MSAPVITIMGPIGAGKTVQAQSLAGALGWETFSTGQLVRDDNNEAVKAIMNSGKLSPTEYIQDLVLRKLRTIPDGKGIILDGSPRMMPEAERLDKELPAMGRKINLVVFLQIAEPEVERRLAQRGRPDDAPEIIKVRWQEYQCDTMPVVEHYRTKGVVAEVDALGTPQEVTARIQGVLRHAGLA